MNGKIPASEIDTELSQWVIRVALGLNADEDIPDDISDKDKERIAAMKEQADRLLFCPGG